MFDFPATPVDGQKFTPSGGPNYIYSTPTWKFDPQPTVPDAPKDGQTYGRMNGLWADVTEEAPSDGITYGRKNGAWATIVGGAVISDTAPTGTLQAGQMWWESDTGSLYIYYDDGDSKQWVMVVPGAPSNPQIVGDLDMQNYKILNLNFATFTTGATLQSTAASNVIIAPGASGTIYLRPLGATSAPGQTAVSQGAVSISAAAGANSQVVYQDETQAIKGYTYWDRGTNSMRMYHLAAGVQAYIDSTGLNVNSHFIATGNIKAGNSSGGYFCKAGINGAYSNIFNYFWNSSVMQVWVDAVNLGNMSITSDYRIKKDVKDLDRTWDIVKALRPVKYTQADYAPLFTADDIPRWGFIAHEMQATMIMDAATGYKDAPDLVQSPNPWTIIAALTKTVQELQSRVEALEAR